MNKKKFAVGLAAFAVWLSALAYPFTLNPVTDLKGAQDGNSIVLTWTDNSTGEDRYEIQVLRKAKRGSEIVATIPAPADSGRYVFGPVAPRQEFIFRVRPAQGLVYTAFSNVVTVRTR